MLVTLAIREYFCSVSVLKSAHLWQIPNLGQILSLLLWDKSAGKKQDNTFCVIQALFCKTLWAFCSSDMRAVCNNIFEKLGMRVINQTDRGNSSYCFILLNTTHRNIGEWLVHLIPILGYTASLTDIFGRYGKLVNNFIRNDFRILL